MNRPRWFLSSEIPNGDPFSSRFHVIPVPFEETVSYGGGTNAGPEAIIAASSQLELYDNTGIPAEYGIHTQEEVRRLEGEPLERFFSRISGAASAALAAGAVPVTLGGEHSVTFAPVAACADRFSRIGVIQFDAHADLRSSYGGSSYSHASVMRRITEELKLPLYQIGLRSICTEEADYISGHQILGITAEEAAAGELTRLQLPEDFPEAVYITVDVDGLDPSIMPATGTPVPGGLGWYQLMGMLKSICAQRRVVGCDVVELSPIAGLHFCEFTAAQLVYNLMGFIGRSAGQ
jgi:agmatinase